MAKAAWAFLAVALAAAAVGEAITCNEVTGGLYPCLNYIVNGTPLPGTCCGSITGLYNRAGATADRRVVCSCLKNMYSQYNGHVNPDILRRAIALPRSCGINLPFAISPNINCARVF